MLLKDIASGIEVTLSYIVSTTLFIDRERLGSNAQNVKYLIDEQSKCPN